MMRVRSGGQDAHRHGRIATGGIAQETNTFQRELTTLADFQRPGGSSCSIWKAPVPSMEAPLPKPSG